MGHNIYRHCCLQWQYIHGAWDTTGYKRGGMHRRGKIYIDCYWWCARKRLASDSELELPRPAAISRVLHTGGSTTSRLHHMQSYLRLLMPTNDKRHAVPLFPCVPSYNRPTHPGGDKKTGTASPTVVRDGRAPHDRIPTERNPLPRNTPRRRRYRLAVGPTRSPRPLPT